MVKIFGCDIDGTLTDGGIYYFSTGIRAIKFNRKDGHGFQLLREKDIKTVVVSKSKDSLIEDRCRDLKIDHILLGIDNKIDALNKLFAWENYSWSGFAYIGDDINDIEVLTKSYVSAAPRDAVCQVRKMVQFQCRKNGGNGAVREFIDFILGGMSCGTQ